MKKTALTFGLFSLVTVATSFAAPEAPTYLAANDSIKTLPIDGGAAGGVIKKQDFHGSNTELQSNHLNFANVNQSLGHDKKVD
ncbi:hypothetical protein [Flavobacterium foetidum]|uniref:hypothetical protein n=1 Tax=Flavobacterium foetidum TaxID=2026681 RepID=UPI0010751C57|nr:hypothetical protein [Flavobacterium foetidum]KAF2514551.1 hypothetical protein E0W73_11390 [Flavobacterium foetidum]